MKSCDDVQDRLADAGVDALRGDPELASHLAGCDDCLAVLDGLSEVDDWLAEPFAAPAHLADAAIRRIESENDVPAEPPATRIAKADSPADRPRRRIPLPVAIGGFGLAASALLVGGLGLLVSLSDGAQAPETASVDVWADDDRFAAVLMEEKEETGEESTGGFFGGEESSARPTNAPVQELEPEFEDQAARTAGSTEGERRHFAADLRDSAEEVRPGGGGRGSLAPPPVAAAPARERMNRQEHTIDRNGDELNGLGEDDGRFDWGGDLGIQDLDGIAVFEEAPEPEVLAEAERPVFAYDGDGDGTLELGENGRRSGRDSSTALSAPTDELGYRGVRGEWETARDSRWQLNDNEEGGQAIGRIHGNTATLSRTTSSVAMTSEFLAGRDRIEGLTFRDARGYWRNTYVPGDPTLRQLEDRLGGGARSVADGAAPVAQPFDAPDDAALAVYMSTDRRTAAGETRTLVQVGIQGTPRRAGRRPSMNIALVLDLTNTPGAEEARAIRELIEDFGGASDVGDRFSLVVAGRAGGVVIPADQMRYGPATVAAQWLTGVINAPEELVDERNLNITDAYEEAIRMVSNGDDPTAPLGSSLVWLVTPRSFGAANPGIAHRAHVAAVAGIPTSVLGVGSGISTGELESIALAGQGTRRQLNTASEAGQVVSEEITAASSVVARAVRLRIRLAPGTRLVNVIGSERLDILQAERVRQAERSIDQRLSRSMGIQSDRGEDEDGIQIVIPAFYAGDSHVILLDVVADGPGPVADVTMRFKDLINLRNGTARSAASLGRGEVARGPLERNVLKNLLAWELSEALRGAGELARQGNPNAAAQTIEAFAERLRATRAALPGMAGDADVDADLGAIADYLHALRDTSLRSRPNELADALLFSSYRELQLPVSQ